MFGEKMIILFVLNEKRMLLLCCNLSLPLQVDKSYLYRIKLYSFRRFIVFNKHNSRSHMLWVHSDLLQKMHELRIFLELTIKFN